MRGSFTFHLDAAAHGVLAKVAACSMGRPPRVSSPRCLAKPCRVYGSWASPLRASVTVLPGPLGLMGSSGRLPALHHWQFRPLQRSAKSLNNGEYTPCAAGVTGRWLALDCVSQRRRRMALQRSMSHYAILRRK